MASLLRYSVFRDVLIFNLDDDDEESNRTSELQLRRSIRYQIEPDRGISTQDLVVFDFETTGLDASQEQIIEIGAIRLRNWEPVAEYSQLVNPGEILSDTVVKLTGLTNEDLKDQPPIEQVFDGFLKFISNGLLVAHNAEFDMAFLVQTAHRLGYDLSWPAFCTLKMARTLLPELESKNLDTLASYYDLSFEARHRSIGDVKVTCAVLKAMVDDYGQDLKTWSDFQQYWVTKS